MKRSTIFCLLFLCAGVFAWQLNLFGMQTCLGFAGAGIMMAIPAVVAPFPVDSELTSIAVAYRNERLIADDVLPRVPVGAQNFKYRKYALADGFTIPQTTVGRTGTPNQVEFGFSEEDGSTNDEALDEPVPNADIENAPAGYDPLARATLSVIDLVLLAREFRTASLVFNPANFATGNKVTHTGASQYSHADSDPIKDLLTRMDLCVMRPNKIVMGQAVYTVLRQHPKVVKATHGNSGDSGVAAREAIAELLEIEQLLVGSGWYNTAKKGQSPVMARIWGKHLLMFHQDAMADTRGRISFGYTAQFGSRIAGKNPDPDIGMRGGIKVRAGESVKEFITANDLGYLITNVIA